jgi:NAD(P)-dependent dehydrogenase (short-subunit alcohol dehydrogenase family)
MSTVLITGANRGIGLEFARQYAAAGARVIGTARVPEEAGELAALKAAYGDGVVRIERLELRDGGSVAALGRVLEGVAVDLLLHNAAILPWDGHRPGSLDYAAWQDTLVVNAIGPVRLTEALIENVAASEAKRVVAISSTMGSISRQASAGTPEWQGYYQYRTSKAALNMGMVLLAKDLRPRGITVAVIAPGWVQTRMGGPHAVTPAEESVGAMRRVIDRLTFADTGRWFNYDGQPIAW